MGCDAQARQWAGEGQEEAAGHWGGEGEGGSGGWNNVVFLGLKGKHFCLGNYRDSFDKFRVN